MRITSISTRQKLRRSVCVWASPILHKLHATVFACDTSVSSRKPMALNYYIDESGNSGDVLSSGDNYNFNGQPVFSLACIGVDNVDNLKQFILNLKIKYQIHGG